MTIMSQILRGARVGASVTLGNISLSEGYTGPGGGSVSLSGGTSASYAVLYNTQPWVAIVVNKLVRQIARLPLKVYGEPDADGARQRIREGPLADLMRQPYEGGSPFDWKSEIVGNLALYGNAVVVKQRSAPGMPPVELIPSCFAYWSVVPSSDGRPLWYTFTGANGKRIPFRPSEVVHFKWWGPGPGLVGPSPLEPLRRTLRIEDAAVRSIIASYENGMRPQGAISVDHTFRDETVAARLREQLQSVYGGVENAFKVMLLEGGAKWLDMSHNLVDAELTATRKATREEVAAMYDIPQPMIGLLDRATFSNIVEQHLMLYQDTFGPWLTMQEETLQVQLIDREPMFAGQYVEYDLNEVLKGDPLSRMQAYAQATNFMTPNEKRERENLPRIDDPGADAIWMPSGSLPIGAEMDTAAFVKNATPTSAIAEARCPTRRDDGSVCNRLLARNLPLTGATELYCPACKSRHLF